MRIGWLAILALIAVVGCDALGGKKEKGSLLPSELGAPDHARVDPDYRYKRAYLAWQANHDSIVEGMDSRSTLQVNDAFKSAQDALKTMRRYLVSGLQEQVDGFLARYDKVYVYVGRGNYNSGIHSMLESIRHDVMAVVSPELVTTVVPEGEAYAAATEPPRDVKEPKKLEAISPAMGAPTAGPVYRTSWDAWQKLNGELMERLYSSSPRVDDLHPKMLAALDAMAPSLSKDLQGALGQIRQRYDVILMSVQTNGVTKDVVEQVAGLQRMMETTFSPEKVTIGEPKSGPGMGAPRK